MAHHILCQIALAFFYTHLKMFPFDGVFPDFEYNVLHLEHDFLNKKMHHNHLAN
jgi:hypothetical protein